MRNVALRPLNTSLVRASLDHQMFESVDVDAFARRVFAEIDANAPQLRPAIAAKLVEALAAWTGDAGTDEEFASAKRELTAALSESLAAAYASEMPLRAVPAPPMIRVSASPAPLPPDPAIADARKWVLMWEASSLDSDAQVRTELVAETAREPRAVEATAFERALLASDFKAIAETPIELTPNAPKIPDGPASGFAVLDVTKPMGIRAVAVRNFGLPVEFIYTSGQQSEVLAPSIDRVEEIAVASRAEIAALTPSRVEVWYEHGDPSIRLPVVLVIDNFDVPLVESAMAEWRKQTDAPPGGEFILDVTAGRLRLRRVLVR